jgi:alpha-1,3-rhamnosyltransferase
LNAVSNQEKETMPLVSFIVPVYNHERFVEASLRSLIGQTYGNLELIIVADGSSDNSLGVIRAIEAECKSRFVRCIVFEQSNSGIAASLNRGIAASKGSFLLWLASDDLAEPDAVSTLLPHLLHDNQIGLVCGDADFIDAQGNLTTQKHRGEHFRSSIRYSLARKKEDFDLAMDFGAYRSFLGGHYMPIGCLIRRSHFLEAGYFDPTYVAEDSELWLRLSKLCRFKFVDTTLFHRRLHETNAHQTMRIRLSLDSVRLMLREARYCIDNGLADQWQKCAEQRLQRHHRHLMRLVQENVGNARQSVLSRFLKYIRG